VALDMNIAIRKYIRNITKKYLLKLGIVLLNLQEYIICFLGNNILIPLKISVSIKIVVSLSSIKNGFKNSGNFFKLLLI
jgi:hypothetical protein